jgi:hypothetical protein
VNGTHKRNSYTQIQTSYTNLYFKVYVCHSETVQWDLREEGEENRMIES